MCIEHITTRKLHLPALLSAIKQCGKKRDGDQAKAVHLEAIKAGLVTNKFVASALITMYVRCSCMADAREVFETVSNPDVVAWTSLVLGYVESGESNVALDVFAAMDCGPDSFTFVAATKACMGLVSTGGLHPCFCLERGIALHVQAKDLRLESDIFVASSLVKMYSRLGKMEYAQRVFDSVGHRNTVLWTSLILGYVENGLSIIALELFTCVDCEVDSVMVVAALKALAGLACSQHLVLEFLLEKDMDVHKLAKEKGFDTDKFVTSTLVDLYIKSGSLAHARNTFDGVINRSVVLWNSLILGYVDCGRSFEALGLFRSMDIQPDAFTFATVLKGCASLAGGKEFGLEVGMSIHRQAKVFGFCADAYVANTLIDMYGKLGSMRHAQTTFNSMTSRDVVSWNSLIIGYVEHGESITALELFTLMDCEPNTVSFIAAFKACSRLASERRLDWRFCLGKGMRIHKQLNDYGTEKEMLVKSNVIEFYCRYNCMTHARVVFDGMKEKDVVSWNILILGYVENGNNTVALELFASMDCRPNHNTYIAALKACGNMGGLAAGREIHDQILNAGLEQKQVVANSLVDFYGKCGCMSSAEDVFNKLESKDTVSWNALIAGYCALGDADKVFSLAKRMEKAGGEMDGITYLHILTTCNHAGMVDEGREYLESMLRCGSSIKPRMEHYKCIVDMLGRANRREEALALVKSMPFEADAVLWKILYRM